MPHLTTELEEIFTEKERSISLMVNPDLSNFFFWHFHPEYELVYIEGASGTRHVGDHISTYHGSDLVLIGSNIPHLNFDYGVRTRYQKRVVHFREDFPERAAEMVPELGGINRLFKESSHGIAFGELTKTRVRALIFKLEELPPFQQYLATLEILQLLSLAEDREFLHDQPVVNASTRRDHERLKRIYAFVETNYTEKINNREVAELSHLSYEAFCRYFKKMTRLTFTEFVNQYRIDKAKKLLLQGSNVTEACFGCGFESLSYFNRIFKKLTGENPLAFKSHYQG